MKDIVMKIFPVTEEKRADHSCILALKHAIIRKQQARKALCLLGVLLT
jgi:hypothetical protein